MLNVSWRYVWVEKQKIQLEGEEYPRRIYNRRIRVIETCIEYCRCLIYIVVYSSISPCFYHNILIAASVKIETGGNRLFLDDVGFNITQRDGLVFDVQTCAIFEINFNDKSGDSYNIRIGDHNNNMLRSIIIYRSHRGTTTLTHNSLLHDDEPCEKIRSYRVSWGGHSNTRELLLIKGKEVDPSNIIARSTFDVEEPLRLSIRSIGGKGVCYIYGKLILFISINRI